MWEIEQKFKKQNMKDKRTKDQVRHDDIRSFINNLSDNDYIDMIVRFEKTPRNKLNYAENLMCDIIYKNYSFNKHSEVDLKEMESLLLEYMKEKPRFKNDLGKHLKLIQSALETKKRNY